MNEPPTKGRALLVPLLLACLAALVPYTRTLIAPVVVFDDFQILGQSWTWQKTLDGFWVPQNEHAMPLGRLLTFALNRLAGSPERLPRMASCVGPAALLAAMWLVYVFVRREMEHPLYGLLALVLFGASTVYHQAVVWFAASFAVLSLDTILLGLLAAQRWRQTGHWIYLVLTMLACLLAPGWFALGILAGPLCAWYLLLPPVGPASRAGPLVPLGSRLLLALAPLLGTVLFLAISLPNTAATIMHLSHYNGVTAVQAFKPREGLYTTARSLVDNLLIGVAGTWEVEVSEPYVFALFAAAYALGVWWLWQSSRRRLMFLGTAFMLGAYWLVYSARADWGYEGVMTQRVWSRYHLLPHLGLVLFFCGGMSGRSRWFHLNAEGTLTRRQQLGVCALIFVCLLVNLPRGWICAETANGEQFQAYAEQQADLRLIAEVDARCREHHISAEAARKALPRFTITWSNDVIDGWDFLRGSDAPHPMSPKEVQRLLESNRQDAKNAKAGKRVE